MLGFDSFAMKYPMPRHVRRRTNGCCRSSEAKAWGYDIPSVRDGGAFGPGTGFAVRKVRQNNEDRLSALMDRTYGDRIELMFDRCVIAVIIGLRCAPCNGSGRSVAP